MQNWRVGLASLFLVVVSCTKPNPKSCIDGTCTTEEYPFCDVDGSFAGEPQTCIAVDCEPDAFVQCRDDNEFSCNAAGTDYDSRQCPLGCQDGVGCRVCSPNETVCANGAVQTCDAGGNVVSNEPCALGCFEDQPRCRNIDPSNGLGVYVDMVFEPPDLDLSAGGTIASTSGTITDSHGQPIDIPSFLTPAPLGGVAVRVFVANNVEFGTVKVLSGVDGTPGPAVAVVAKGTIEISGSVLLWYDSSGDGAYDFAGGIDDTSCRGGPGQEDGVPNGNYKSQSVASGGGGHATRGGKGGSINTQFAGGKGGLPSGSMTLVPLRGGCASGGVTYDANQPQAYGGVSGGGALELVSNVAIRLQTNAVINASGSMGAVQVGGPMPEIGGGAGGGILLEAPVVQLGQGSRLLVNGGPGASGGDYPGLPSLSGDVAVGGQCGAPVANFECSNGGNGATLAAPANDVLDLPRAQNTPNLVQRTGSGGGGLGFIRINTTTGHYDSSSDAILSGVSSAGMIETR